MALRKHYMIRHAAINTHVNQGLKNGIFPYVLRRHPLLNLITWQESHSEAALNDALPPGWLHWPRRQPGEDTGKGGNEAGTFVSWKDSRFLFQGGVNWDIGFGNWPRRMTGVILMDKRTHHLVFISSHHPDPLNPRDWDDANAHVKQTHIRQVAQFVKWHASNMKDDGFQFERHIHISSGDTNEVVAALNHPDDALHQFRDARMHPTFLTARRTTGPVRLMNIFTNHNSPSHEVLWHKAYETGVRGMDHEVVVVGIKVPVQR